MYGSPESKIGSAGLTNGRTSPLENVASQAELEKLAQAGLEQAKKAAKQVERIIVSHPTACLGAAAVVGLVVGMMVKRR